MYWGLMSMIQRCTGGRLYHCRYCRIQFYDRRALAVELERATNPGELATKEDAVG
jgi:hypothetical protein